MSLITLFIYILIILISQFTDSSFSLILLIFLLLKISLNLICVLQSSTPLNLSSPILQRFVIYTSITYIYIYLKLEHMLSETIPLGLLKGALSLSHRTLIIVRASHNVRIDIRKILPKA